MEQDIQKVMRQFDFEPTIANSDKLGKYERFVVGGMGGSHLPADFVKSEDSSLDMVVHSDYGLPFLPKGDKGRLYIAVSHSGNTEETLDFAAETLKKNLPLAVISSGGKEIEFAKENSLPHIDIPLEGLEPRMATIYMVIALLAVMGKKEKIDTLKTAAKEVDLKASEHTGKGVAKFVGRGTPLFYASHANDALAHFWKIVSNETGKHAAFNNFFPELNHNEMMSFVLHAKDFKVVYLVDGDDHPRIKKRMEIMKELVVENGGSVETIELSGKSRFEKMVFSMLGAYWMAYGLAAAAKVDPDDIGLIEEFKRRILK